MLLSARWTFILVVGWDRRRSRMVMIFFLGALVGVLIGEALCIRYLRREIAADIGPKLRRVQVQLDNLEAALNLALMSRYADLSKRIPPDPAI